MFIKDYLALSPEDREIIKERAFEQERTPADWIDAFKKVAKVDEQGDKVTTISFVVGIIGIVCLVLTIIGYIGEIYWLIALLVPGSLLTIVGWLTFIIIKGFDLPNEVLKETILPILHLLKEDIKRNGKVTLKMDLRGYDYFEKVIGSEDVPNYSRHKIKNHFYQDNWMEGKTVLADGTKLTWKIEDYVRRRVKKKYGSSGKYKGKEIKEKIKSNIIVKAGVNKKNFSLPVGLKHKGKEGNISTKKLNGVQWMIVKKKYKHAEGERFLPKHFIDTVAEVYMRAKPKGGN